MRVWAPDWHPLPGTMLQAIVAAEDREFFARPVQNSALTFQIAGWFLLPEAARLKRLSMAERIGTALSHDEVLRLFAQRVYLGQACFGVTSAAVAYFGKSVDDLQAAEFAYLAALARAPFVFHPVQAIERARHRRDFVLSEMARIGAITEGEALQATSKLLGVRTPIGRCPPR